MAFYRSGGGENGDILDIPVGYYVDVGTVAHSFPIDATATVFGYMANVKGYSTLTINNQKNMGVVGIKDDGTLTALTNYGNTSYSSVDITDYDYLWITHGTTSSHRLQISIS